MSKELAFLQRAFSPPYEAGGRHIAAVFMVALLSFFMPIFVESPAKIQVIVSVAWAQSANSGGQDSVPVGEEEVAPGAEQEGAQASFPESEGWDFTPGILFRIETFIGKKIKYGRWD